LGLDFVARLKPCDTARGQTEKLRFDAQMSAQANCWSRFDDYFYDKNVVDESELPGCDARRKAKERPLAVRVCLFRSASQRLLA
jgi:hypothetical protein